MIRTSDCQTLTLDVYSGRWVQLLEVGNDKGI